MSTLENLGLYQPHGPSPADLVPPQARLTKKEVPPMANTEDLEQLRYLIELAETGDELAADELTTLLDQLGEAAPTSANRYYNDRATDAAFPKEKLASRLFFDRKVKDVAKSFTGLSYDPKVVCMAEHVAHVWAVTQIAENSMLEDWKSDPEQQSIALRKYCRLNGQFLNSVARLEHTRNRSTEMHNLAFEYYRPMWEVLHSDPDFWERQGHVTLDSMDKFMDRLEDGEFDDRNEEQED